MSCTPLVSVIIIVRNNSAAFEKAVASVRAQSYANYELLVVDDGSDEPERARIAAISTTGNNTRLLALECNAGRAAARQRGLDEARGQYLCFLDSDDRLPPGALGYLVATAERDATDLVFARLATFLADGGGWLPGHYTDTFLGSMPTVTDLQAKPELAMNNAIIGRLYRVAFLREFGLGFPADRRNAEDVSFAFRTQFHARSISLLPTICYYYALGNYLGAASPAKLHDARDALLEIADFVHANGAPAVQEQVGAKIGAFITDLLRAESAFPEEADLEVFVRSLIPLAASEVAKAYYLQRDVDEQAYHASVLAGDVGAVLSAYRARQRAAVAGRATQDQDVREKIAILRAEEKQLDKVMARRGQDIEALLRSSSWKLTRPLRGMLGPVASLNRKLRRS